MRQGILGLMAPERARLRAALGGRPLTTASLPLDIGAATETIPAHLRRAATTRHPHCAFPGCDQPASVCDIHHLIPRARGGPTELPNLVPLCSFHHLTAIHRWGWALTLHPDGTTTATSPDHTRILHSHGPPSPATGYPGAPGVRGAGRPAACGADISARTVRYDMTARQERADSRDKTEKAEPAESTEAKEPTEPTDNAEPTEPMDSIEPRDPIDRNESCDHRDHRDESGPRAAESLRMTS
jgi:hypothetical protein